MDQGGGGTIILVQNQEQRGKANQNELKRSNSKLISRPKATRNTRKKAGPSIDKSSLWEYP